MAFTIVNYYGNQDSRCGYCKSGSGSASHGMHANRMLPADYQDLIDRGWRRSGHYCYKPVMNATCCPCYTIKCDALEFKLSKSHKKILKRLNRFLKEGKRESNDEEADKEERSRNECDNNEPEAPKEMLLLTLNLTAIDEANSSRISMEKAKADAEAEEDEAAAAKETEEEPKEVTTIPIPNKSLENVSDNSAKSNNSMNPPKKKAKQIRLERRQAKMEAKGIDIATVEPKLAKNKEKTLQDYLNEPSATDKHQLKIKLVTNPIHASEDCFNLYRKYQLTIHNDNPSKLKPSSLENFLYKSPLEWTPEGTPHGYGSFHQQYWLDEKLIAVAVIDILPYCVSSVYFFYDPDYSFLSLGTYASLREIALVQELAKSNPLLRYYYMGFYIHSCPKMRYKGRLSSSYLLCPETYTWHLLTDEIRAKLDENKYQRLASDLSLRDKNEFKDADLDNVLLWLGGTMVVRYRDICQITGESDDREMILEYGKLVGKSCAHRMIYIAAD